MYVYACVCMYRYIYRTCIKSEIHACIFNAALTSSLLLPSRVCLVDEQEAAKCSARLSKRYSILATCCQRVGDLSGAVRAIAHGIMHCVYFGIFLVPFYVNW